MVSVRALRTPGFLLWAAFATLYAVYSVSRYRQFLPAGYDLGIFDQAVRNYSQFQAPIVSLKGADFNLLGDHFHPILVLLAPLYWIWDDARVLLLAQAALVALSVVVVRRFAARHFGTRTSLALAVAYGLGWPIQGLIDFDFHEVAFAIPLLAVALDALDRRSDRVLALACIGLVLVREDMGLLVVMIGLVRLFTHPPRWRGVALVAAGVVGYEVATKLVLPHFSPTGEFVYWSYDALGPDLPSALATIVRHPVSSAELFFTPGVKTLTMVWLLAPVAFVALRSPLVLVSLPLLAQRFFSSREHLWTPEFHYSAVIWPIVFVAALDGMRRLRDSRFAPAWSGAGVRAWAAAALAVPLVGTCVSFAMFPFHLLLTGATWELDPHMRDQAAILREIPPSTCVYADDRLAVHLTHTHFVSLPGKIDAPPDFVVLDLSQDEVGFELPSPQVVLARVEAEGFRVVEVRGDLLLLQSPEYAGPTPACTP